MLYKQRVSSQICHKDKEAKAAAKCKLRKLGGNTNISYEEQTKGAQKTTDLQSYLLLTWIQHEVTSSNMESETNIEKIPSSSGATWGNYLANTVLKWHTASEGGHRFFFVHGDDTLDSCYLMYS